MSQVMSIEIKPNEFNVVARIIVVGVGGAGNNAINRMIDDNVQGVEFIGINTDKQDLACCKAPKLIGIGERLTKGLGAGGDPAIGEGAERHYKDKREALLSGRGGDMAKAVRLAGDRRCALLVQYQNALHYDGLEKTWQLLLLLWLHGQDAHGLAHGGRCEVLFQQRGKNAWTGFDRVSEDRFVPLLL